MSPRQIHFLLLTSAVLVITSHQYLTALRLQHTPPPQTNPTSILKHCYILTLNASLKPRTLSPGLTCYPFLAERFNEQQFALVAPIAQQKLLYPEKQTMASDLTNNNSVSIYFNHARMWKKVASGRDSVLLLEDDAILSLQSVRIINEILKAMKHEDNFILKLLNIGHITNPISIGVSAQQFALKWWEIWYTLPGYTVSRCTCRPWVRTACAAAYIMDASAAKSLLQHSLPMSKHVDAYMHEQGCVFKHVNFSAIDPPLVALSGRPTLHKHQVKFLQHLFLHMNEIIDNILNQDCSNTSLIW